MATWKRHVALKQRDGADEHYVPNPRLADAPLRLELRTLHVDRFRLDRELLRRTVDRGVTVVRDTVASIERDGRKIF